MFHSPHAFFRVLGIAEAISWTLLIGGMILRSTHGLDIAVTIGGGIHGFVFLAFGAAAVIVAMERGTIARCGRCWSARWIPLSRWVSSPTSPAPPELRNRRVFDSP